MTKNNLLPDTQSIAEFMNAFGHPVRDKVLTNPTEAERILRGRLVLEEAFELIEALGLSVSINGAPAQAINPKSVSCEINPDAEYDPVETLDALGDIIVVSKGAGLQFGLPVDRAVLEEIAPSNMSKMGEDGKPIFDAGGKILKGPNFFGPNIPRLIEETGSMTQD